MAWVEQTSRRTHNNKIWQDSVDPAKFALDLSIGSQHYLSGSNWLDINTNWQADTGAWQYRMLESNYQLHSRNVLNAGDTIQWLDPVSGETVTLQPLALNWVDNVTDSRQQITQPQAVTAIVQGNKLYWPNGYGAGRHFRYTAGNDHLIKEIIIDTVSNLPTPTVANTYLEVEFILKKSAGVTLYVNGAAWDNSTKTSTANAIEFRLSNGTPVWGFSAPVARDSLEHTIAGIMQLRRQGANRYVTVRFPKTWIDTATFPIILDPTLNYSVNASANDAYESAGGDNAIDSSNVNMWHTGDYAAFRWLNVAVPNGATIDTAYFEPNVGGNGVAVGVDLYCEDADNAAIFTTATNGISGRTKTTATARWEATTPPDASPEIKTLIAEVTSRPGWVSGNALVILCKWYSQDFLFWFYDGGDAAVLHIEYTAGGGGGISKPKAMFYYRQRRR